MTQIILRESKEHQFSLTGFWVRRMRRILPAAAVVTLTTLLVGYFILGPVQFVQLGNSALTQSLMVANVFFWKSGGYFAEASELQPLLHTWSLSVEEQFYVGFPLLLIILLSKTRFSTAILAAGTLGSFLLSLYGVSSHPSASFYLLPTRAWELSAGALLALSGVRLALPKFATELLGFAGLSLIIFPMAVYSASTAFPGLAALPPVLGTLMIIAAGGSSPSLVGRALSIKPVVAIGLVSYSLYLWHWPILVFFKHVLVTQSVSITIGALALTGLLSFITWRYVEIPFRLSKRLQRPLTAFAFGAILSGVVVVLGILIRLQSGLPYRFDDELLALQNDITWSGDEYMTNTTQGVPIGVSLSGDAQPDFVLWGDSHGMTVTSLIEEYAGKNHLSGIAMLSSGLPPVYGVWRADTVVGWEEATALNRSRMNYILNRGVKSVILIARWDGWINGYLSTETSDGRHFTDMMVRDGLTKNTTPTESQEALKRQISEMKNEFSSNGIRVWVLLQIPSVGRSAVAMNFYQKKRFPSLNAGDFSLGTTREDYERRRKKTVQLFHELQSEGFYVIDPIEAFFGSNNRVRLYSLRALYRDDDHLTKYGASHYLRDSISSIFSSMEERDLSQ